MTKSLSRAISADVPEELRKQLLFLPDHARSMGIHIMAGKGSGKSRLMGRAIGWLDFIRGVPLVILDPNGPTIDNILDKITRLPEPEQRQLWKRIVYVDMAGRGDRVVPFPLYFRLGNETLYEMSQRYLDTVRKTDPQLQTASIQGWNALYRTGTYTGIVLASLGCQITEAASLIEDTEAWEHKFPEASVCFPDVAPALAFFTQQLPGWDQRTRSMQTDSFLNKVTLFSLDPSLQAMFGAATPGINWQEVIAKRQAVFLDFRHVHDLELRRFKMLWAFTYFLTFIKMRGAGRHRPVSLIIDELTALSNFDLLGPNPFSADLDELINVIARNYSVWLTICHQELFQLDERSQKTLMTMGTQIIGTTSDSQAALALAKQFFRIDPSKVKRYEPVYSSFMGESSVIDVRPVEYTIEQQHYLASYLIKDQPTFHFLARIAKGEGDSRGSLMPITIKQFDKNQWVNEALVTQARGILRARTGVRVTDVLAAIAQRSRYQLHEARGGEPTATMSDNAHHIPAQETREEEDDDDELFREKK